jgi:ketosteroid isomerase-like protein
MSLEQQGWAALSRGEGRNFYGEVLADDAVVVVPGAVLGKEQTLASWDGVAPWQWYDLIWRDALDLDCAAVVIYEVVAQRPPEPPYRATICSTYARRPDGWRLVLHQQTPST